MSVIIDFYKGNGGGCEDENVFIRRNGRCVMFRFFRLTIIKWDTDIFNEFKHLIQKNENIKKGGLNEN